MVHTTARAHFAAAFHRTIRPTRTPLASPRVQPVRAPLVRMAPRTSTNYEDQNRALQPNTGNLAMDNYIRTVQRQGYQVYQTANGGGIYTSQFRTPSGEFIQERVDPETGRLVAIAQPPAFNVPAPRNTPARPVMEDWGDPTPPEAAISPSQFGTGFERRVNEDTAGSTQTGLGIVQERVPEYEDSLGMTDYEQSLYNASDYYDNTGPSFALDETELPDGSVIDEDGNVVYAE